jgi:hypothetical protein
MRSSTVFVLGLFLSILASGASGLAGLRQHLRVEVCPRHHLRLAGRGAVQAGIGNTRLLRQAIRHWPPRSQHRRNRPRPPQGLLAGGAVA